MWLVVGYSLRGFTQGVYSAQNANAAHQAFVLANRPCIVWRVNDLDPQSYSSVVEMANAGVCYASVFEEYAYKFFAPRYETIRPDFDKWWAKRSCKSQNNKVG